jgi:hypothetical protein
MVEKSNEHSAKELEVLAQTIIYEPGNCTDEEEDAPGCTLKIYRLRFRQDI